jgi:thiamine-monophosphate kinase
MGVVGDLDFLELALLGGEDFELLFTVPEERVDETGRRIGEVGTTVSRIGTVTSGPRRLGSQSLDHWKERGWQHLRGR